LNPDLAGAHEEFARYCTRVFHVPEGPISIPLEDEPALAVWDEYAHGALCRGPWEVLREKLPHLRFPILGVMSKSVPYRAATRSGVPPKQSSGLTLEKPSELNLSIHATAAGRIPVLVTRHRPDFISLVRAFAHGSEPVAIPGSVGARMVTGFNNWDRIHRLRNDFLTRNPGRTEEDWRTEFRVNIKREYQLYQDRFIILNDGPYSGVPAEAVELDEEEWRETGLAIRREHECTHYFTMRVFGSMRNHALDEIIADTMGIIAANGRFRADWFLRFLGLENYPIYRAGARLENYRSDPPLGDEAFSVLQKTVHRIAFALGKIADSLPASGCAGRVALLLALAELGLAKLASEEGSELLLAALARNASRITERPVIVPP
jgi:hypothetical protein